MNLDELEAYTRETGRQLDALERSLAEDRKTLMYVEKHLGRLSAHSRRGIASWAGKAGEYATALQTA